MGSLTGFPGRVLFVDYAAIASSAALLPAIRRARIARRAYLTVMPNFAVVVLVAIAGGGFLGGVVLLAQPDGSGFGLSVDLLPSWHGGDYWWAGALLAFVFGLGLLAAAALLFVRPSAGWLSVSILGCGLALWRAVQIMMLGLILPPMQRTFLVSPSV